MNSVKIKLIREGMVTATEVKDRMGRILLTSGKTITSKHLKVFKTWGFYAEKKEQKIQVKPSIIKEMDNLFQFADRRHPMVNEFYNLCLSRKAKGS